MPIKAKDLMEKFDLKEGRLLGSILKEIEEQWLKNNFKISNNQIEDIVKLSDYVRLKINTMSV